MRKFITLLCNVLFMPMFIIFGIFILLIANHI